MKTREKIIEEKARLFKEMTGLPQTADNVDHHKKLRAMISALNWVLNLGD